MNNSAVTKELWNELADKWYAEKDARGIYDEIMGSPESAFHPDVLEMMGDLQDKNACVIGTGDSVAALAMARLGAEVTAVDNSERIILHSRIMADRLDLPIAAVCSDAMDMKDVPDNAYDIVYTSNGFLTFLSDLAAFMSEVSRILRPGGFYLLFDVHPYIRPFGGYTDRLVLKKDYDQTGPFTAAIVYHWRIEDLVNAAAGEKDLKIAELRELKALPGTFWSDFIRDPDVLKKAEDPSVNQLMKLPQWIAIKAVRSG
jgi:SAM-dependent methyltransferase